MQHLLSLSEFSSVIELAATLNIAFVAIEYVKTYTKVLCNQVFDLKHFIEQVFQECESTLPDLGTLSTIPHMTVNNHNVNEMVEKLKRDRELLQQDIDKTQKQYKEKIDDVCEAKNVSSISLFLFFVGVSGLFLLGIEKYYQAIVRCLWSMFSICSLLYCLAGWICSEKPKNRFVNFESLRHAIIAFVIVFVLSLLALLWSSPIDSAILIIWNWLLPISVLLSFSNFIIASVKIWYKAHDAKDKIKESQKQIIDKCKDLASKAESMISVNNLANDLYQTNESID